MTLRKVAALTVLLCMAFSTSAQERQAYPTKPIRMLASFPAGSPFDPVSRRLAEGMAARLKVAVVVENKPGANGVIAAGEAARATPDGYTLFATIPGPLVEVPITLKVPYDPRIDFAPIGKLVSSASVLLLNAQHKSNSLKELVAEAGRSKEQPISYGSFGPASWPQILMEAFGRRAGVAFKEIPYRGPPAALQDMLGNQIAIGFTSIAQSAALVSQGKAKALAIVGSSRSPTLPTVPTFAESGFDMYYGRRETWFGLLAPARTPPQVVAKLGDTARAVLTEEQFAKWLRSLDFGIVAGSPAQFQQEMDEEVHQVSRFVRDELKIQQQPMN
jgi:tripartite-type tricarboxylate transporter receptor subunit TctC